MKRIGTTETGEPSYDMSWVNNLYDANIIITKNLHAGLRKEVLKNKDKIVLHVTCTGWGHSIVEPNVPDVITLRQRVDELIKDGFPAEQIVLRVDPIIPTTEGLHRVHHVLLLFRDTGIKRCRVSIIDMYDHVLNRIKDTDLEVLIPFKSWFEPTNYVDEIIDVLKLHTAYEFESCAEGKLSSRSNGLIKPIGCVSQKDLDILNCTNIKCEGPSRQRKTCLCPGNKYQLLKSKPGRCVNGCVYCYWKD